MISHTLKIVPMCAVLILLLGIAVYPEELSDYSLDRDSWHFDNFEDPSLSWDIYRSSYIGIPPDPDPSSSAFDYLFYESVFKSELSKTGNCYGMCVLIHLMLQHGGCYGYCLPVNQYSGSMGDAGPTDTNLRLAINQAHGHQASLPSVQFMMKIFARGDHHNGHYAISQFNHYITKNDPPIVSITKTLNPSDGGHTMFPYESEDYSSTKWRLYVYDPSRPWHDGNEKTSFYDPKENYIEIDKSDSSWTFWKNTENSNKVYWSGSPSSGGGLIMMMPLSITGQTARVPSSCGDPLTFLSTFFISGSDADLMQLTDADGKRLFIPGTDDIDTDPTAGMNNTIPWFPMGQSSSDKKVYFMRGIPTGRIDLEVKAGADGYNFGFIGKHSYISVQARGGDGQDLMSVDNAGSINPELILRNQTAATAYDIEFHHIIEPYKKSRIFKITDLRLSEPDKPIILAVSQNQEMLEIKTTEVSAAFDLEMVNIVDKRIDHISKRNLRLVGNNKQSIRPRDWSRLRKEDLKIEQDTIRIDPRKLRPIGEDKQ